MVSEKIVMDTICYFDINQSNGGAIFAKNIHNYINSTDTVVSNIYYNHKQHPTNNNGITKDSNQKQFSLVSQLKLMLLNAKYLELFVYFLRNDLNALLLAIKLAYGFKRQQSSVVLFHDHLSLFYYTLFCSLKNKRVVLIMHNDGSPIEMICLGIRSKWKKKLLEKFLIFQIKTGLKKVSKVVFLCDNAKSKFVRIFDSKNLLSTMSIPNGIKPLDKNQVFDKSDNDIIKFITVCTLNERKGIDTFIRCLPYLNEKFNDKIQFTVVGNGPLINELKALAYNYNNINVVGEAQNVVEMLNNADVFFLLSKTEGQPLSILEAMRASLTIIATDVGCNSSMVNDNNGILINPDDDSVINAFEELIINWNNKYKMRGQASLNLFNDSFKEDKMYQSYLSMIKSL